MSAMNGVDEVGEYPTAFPYANWGPLAALGGVLLALATGLVLGTPAALIGYRHNGELTTWASALVQLATEGGFLIVPMFIAARRGASFREGLARLGVRRFRPSAFQWMAAAVGFYLLCSFAYTLLVGTPHQENIAKGFGALPIQILLIVVAAPICEEVCFLGMLFGGLRQRVPRIGAALISALIFGGLHATTGVSAVPPLIVFGFVLALLYEKTGSIIPGILLHMLNNSVALLAR
jgi:membrane protease YdiL (CAAX protease family)